MKGQVLTPAPLRRKFGIKPGTQIDLIEDGTRIVLLPQTREAVQQLCGILKGSGALEELMKERRRDLEREEKKFAFCRRRTRPQ